jgi:mannose-6-phosphate isomerase-like protein (cupin superfamily)
LLEKDQGSAVWLLGSLTIVKAAGATTSGAFGLIEQLMPVGFVTPYHVHHAEDEAFYVLEGELQIICDGKKLNVGPGGYFFGPREVPHGFRVVGTAPARSLVLNTPAGFEQFVLEMGDPATELVIPAPAPPDMGKLVALCAKRRIDILGPLPE